MSRPNVADWQYLGVDKFTLGLEWNCGRKARKGHICEDTFAYDSYSSKDDSTIRYFQLIYLVFYNVGLHVCSKSAAFLFTNSLGTVITRRNYCRPAYCYGSIAYIYQLLKLQS